MSDEQLDDAGLATGGKVAMIVGATLCTVSVALIVFARLHRDPGLSMIGSGIAIMIVGAIMRRASLKRLGVSPAELGEGAPPEVRVDMERLRARMKEER
jgi:hypothetical protein